MNRVTPYTLTRKALETNVDLMMQYRNPNVGEPGSYEARQPIELNEIEANLSNSEIADISWSTFQNIDDNHLTPDNGRSMMTGDLVLVEVEGRDPAWLITMACGFKDITDVVAGRNMAVDPVLA